MLMARYFNRFKSREAALPWLLTLLAVGYVAYYWSNPVGLYPDSNGYLTFSEHRTAGYPIFIGLTTTLFGTVDAVPKVQLIIAAAAFAFLGWSLCRAFRSSFVALAPVFLLMLYPQIADVHGYILTESLFISLLCIFTGSLALMVWRPTWSSAAVVALACGLAITVRPAGMSLLIVWPFLFWLIWRRCATRRIALVTAVIVPVAVCLIVESMLWHAHHDSESRPNLADRHLFAKALMIKPEPRVSDPELARVVAEGRRVMAPGRELIANAPSHYARTRLLVDFEVAAQHATYRRVFAPEVRAIAQQRGVGEYDVLAQMSRSAILNAPVGWIRNALAHYLGLWFPYWAYVSTDILEEYQAYIGNVEPNTLFADRPIFRHKEPPSPVIRVLLRLTMAAGLIVSTLSVGLVVWRRLTSPSRSPDCRLVVAAVSGLAIHAHFLMVGLLGVVATRYAGAMGPLMAICGVLLASWVIEQARDIEWGRPSAWAMLRRRIAQ